MTFCCDTNMTLYLWWRCGVMWSNRPTDQSVTLWKPAAARERCFTFTIKDKWYISSYCLLFVVKKQGGFFCCCCCFVFFTCQWCGCAPLLAAMCRCASVRNGMSISWGGHSRRGTFSGQKGCYRC